MGTWEHGNGNMGTWEPSTIWVPGIMREMPRRLGSSMAISLLHTWTNSSVFFLVFPPLLLFQSRVRDCSPAPPLQPSLLLLVPAAEGLRCVKAVFFRHLAAAIHFSLVYIHIYFLFFIFTSTHSGIIRFAVDASALFRFTLLSLQESRRIPICRF